MLYNYSKNEIHMACEYVNSNNLFAKDCIVISVVGKHILCDYLYNTLIALNHINFRYAVYLKRNAKELSSTVNKQCFLYCLDLRQENEEVLDDLKEALSHASEFNDSRFVVMTIVPKLIKREDVHSLNEMELSKLSSGTILEKAEEILSDYCNIIDIKELRFDNFLIEDSSYNALNISKMVEQILSDNCVTINPNDTCEFVSAISMSDAVNAALTVLINGKHGNIYNVSGESVSLFDVKSFIYKTLSPYGVSLNVTSSATPEKKTYSALNSGKITSLGFSPVCDTHTQIFYALCGLLPEKFDIINDKINNSYCGKLPYIREMEMELLREVDRICRRNNIQYFLSGGTMLGAVRHKGFIPWDDDIDIAMLREDYKKFKEACINELPKKYAYQSYTNKDGYHYFFDKITIKDTYFSTKYSDSFDMLKGISMDIFVFDKTSDKEFFSKLHFKMLMTLRLIMNVRWKNHARKEKSYLLSKILLPILRIFPMNLYSKMYDKLLRRYEHRDTSTVLPPATDHKWRGVMPKRWFEKVTDAPFEGFMTYIPVGANNYLSRWYCKEFMELLPLCERTGSHDYYRLDIGNAIKADGIDNNKHYNHKGELL